MGSGGDQHSSVTSIPHDCNARPKPNMIMGGPDHLNTTDQYNGHTALNARNAGQGPRPDLSRDNPGQA
eukprot:9385323-Karenia_brevis.AAC.1